MRVVVHPRGELSLTIGFGRSFLAIRVVLSDYLQVPCPTPNQPLTKLTGNHSGWPCFCFAVRSRWFVCLEAQTWSAESVFVADVREMGI